MEFLKSKLLTSWIIKIIVIYIYIIYKITPPKNYALLLMKVQLTDK